MGLISSISREEDFDRVIRVNLNGSFLVGQAVAGYMFEKALKRAARRASSSTFPRSTGRLRGLPTRCPYSISKGG